MFDLEIVPILKSGVITFSLNEDPSAFPKPKDFLLWVLVPLAVVFLGFENAIHCYIANASDRNLAISTFLISLCVLASLRLFVSSREIAYARNLNVSVHKQIEERGRLSQFGLTRMVLITSTAIFVIAFSSPYKSAGAVGFLFGYGVPEAVLALMCTESVREIIQGLSGKEGTDAIVLSSKVGPGEKNKDLDMWKAKWKEARQ